MLRLAKKQSTILKIHNSDQTTPVKCPSSPEEIESNSNGENRVPDMDETTGQISSKNHFSSCGNITLHSHVELHKMHSQNGTPAHVI